MRQALAASSAKEASAASDVDVVEKNQMGGEKPVLLIGSPTCQTFYGVITTMMRDANRVSEVKYKNFVEQCVRHVPGNTRRLFLHENLSDKWSRGLSFVKKLAESDGMPQRRVSCADLSRHCVLRRQNLVSRRNQSASLRSWTCVAATKRSGPRFM